MGKKFKVVFEAYEVGKGPINYVLEKSQFVIDLENMPSSITEGGRQNWEECMVEAGCIVIKKGISVAFLEYLDKQRGE